MRAKRKEYIYKLLETLLTPYKPIHFSPRFLGVKPGKVDTDFRKVDMFFRKTAESIRILLCATMQGYALHIPNKFVSLQAVRYKKRERNNAHSYHQWSKYESSRVA